MDQHELGRFLRHRREELQPGDVGLVAGGRRRAPGLRRDEVAVLAAMSSDFYERIEQGRGPRPSPEMLGAICRALRFTLDERDHAYHLAGHTPPTAHQSLRYAEAGLMCVLDAVSHSVPALITDDMHNVVAQNPLNVALLGPLAGADGDNSNFLWRWFTDRTVRDRYVDDENGDLGREYVADLRAVYGQRSTDPALRALVARLQAASPEFTALWDRQEVAVRHSTRKVLQHPDVGRLDLRCDPVLSPASGQRLVLFRPQPGTGTAERLRLLEVVGTESFATRVAPEVLAP